MYKTMRSNTMRAACLAWVCTLGIATVLAASSTLEIRVPGGDWREADERAVVAGTNPGTFQVRVTNLCVVSRQVLVI